MNAVRDPAFELSDKEFKYICQLVYDFAGIVLNHSKREMVYRRLTRIVRERKLNSFREYYQMLKADPEKERVYFVNAITTNLTSFFRENHHFDYLRDEYLPYLITNNSASKRIRVWSSASSTGEEPYSIAMVLEDVLGQYRRSWDIKLLATDIDSNVLSHAVSGIYDEKRIEGLTPDYASRFLTKGKGANASKVKVNDRVKSIITFKQLNLLHEWPMNGPFDIIFCRNVIIYFDKETQNDLFDRFYDILAPGGLLLLGHSESLGQYQKYFENIGRTIFRKPV